MTAARRPACRRLHAAACRYVLAARLFLPMAKERQVQESMQGCEGGSEQREGVGGRRDVTRKSTRYVVFAPREYCRRHGRDLPAAPSTTRVPPPV